MRLALRIAALAIAVAGLADPAIARRPRAPLSMDFRLPAASDPGFATAEAIRKEIEAALPSHVSVHGGAAPDALVAIGDTDVIEPGSARVFALPLAVASPDTSITEVDVPAKTRTGQSITVTASVHASGAAGRKSSVALEFRGAILGSIDHTWGADDEKFDARLPFVPPGAGSHRLRVRVSTDGVPTSIADALAVVRDQPLRVLVYEPRPSWPAAFIRRSLESDPLFDVASTARTSQRSETMVGEAPRSVGTLDLDRFEAVIAGAPEELRPVELDALNAFVTERGGTLVLVPDRQVTGAVRGRFDLPLAEEVLLEKPAAIEGGGVSLEASELLLLPPSGVGAEPIATIRRGTAMQPVVATFDRGQGRVVFSGALDAWRYRAAAAPFAAFWRALVADAAVTARPRLAVDLTPNIAREGDRLVVSVSVRATELERRAATIRVPAVSAAIVASSGQEEMIRLWPGPRLGSFVGRLRAPIAGQYTVSASLNGITSAVPLLVGEDVVRASHGSNQAAAFAARATDGAVVSSPSELVRELATIDTGTSERMSRPMRSGWWILPFSLMLCAEWTSRRRVGLR